MSDRVTILTGIKYGGHLTLSWDARNQETLLDIIQKKMDEGFEFFIMEKTGLRKREMKKITDTDQISERKVVVKDEDIADLIRSGVAEVAHISDEEIKTVRRARTAKEAAENDTIGVQKKRGG